MPKLYTFTISHYAEKARWALDHKRVAYDEQRLLPGPHMFVTKRLGRKTSVPVLLDGERSIQGSSAIIDYADERWPAEPLTPLDAGGRQMALALERQLDCDFGEVLRRAFYADALSHRALVVPLFTQGGPWWGPLFYRVGFGFVARGIRDMYDINQETAARDHERLAEEVERLDALLQGKQYLVGERFSRADLTLAALAAPMFDPPEHSTRWPAASLYPPRVAELRQRFVGTRLHAHVLRMYREHRQPRATLAA
jgi:glutathione S-transferase